MSFTRAKPAGWIDGEEINGVEITHIDINQSRAVDGFAGGSYAPTAQLEWLHQLIVDVTTVVPANVTAIHGVGKGSGYGISGSGGASSGSGVYGEGGLNTGGGTGGIGGEFIGMLAGYGAKATGGITAGAGGILALGGVGGGYGIEAHGSLAYAGVYTVGGDTAGAAGTITRGGVGGGNGVNAFGVLTGVGIEATGGATNGTGVHGIAGGAGIGVWGNATGAGAGAIGVYGHSDLGYGISASGDTTNPPARSAFRIVPQAADPTSGSCGDLIVTLAGVLRIYNGAGWGNV